MSDKLDNISWDNTEVYKDLNDPQIQKDLDTISSNIEELNKRSATFQAAIPKIDSLTEAELNDFILPTSEFMQIELESVISLRSISVFARCVTVVDSINIQAKDLSSKISKISAQFGQTTKPVNLFLTRSPDSFIQKLFERPETRQFKFNIQDARKMKDHLLSVEEEKLITGLATDGLHAWGKLYNDLASSIKVDVEGKNMGLAAASSILRNGTNEQREEAYRAIENGWDQNKESAAAILNAINGWRNEMFKNRSKKKDLHYLDQSCHTARITRKTLDTLMETTHERVAVGRKANQLMAKAAGVDKIAPWDILQPAPFEGADKKTSFPDAMKLIIKAFSEFDPAMGEFAQMMQDKRWIDGLPTENRGSGAHCTGFPSKRQPRVFMTYNGGMGDIITLAHELGHAYHNWVLKDVPFMEAGYSMTLAETASVFAETLVRNYILENSESREEKLTILWQELQSASAFLINIPARFDFEKSLVEMRKEKNASAEELCQLTTDAWNKWYGDTISETAPYFWASKLHFSISGLSFYNYPYLFGYLFSLGIYSEKDKRGEGFKPLYEEILKDTGIMTAEDLVQKNLGLDIENADFWNNSIDIVKKSIDQFEELL